MFEEIDGVSIFVNIEQTKKLDLMKEVKKLNLNGISDKYTQRCS